MNGLAFRRALEVCAGLDRSVVALRDNDGQSPETFRQELEGLLATGRRELLVGDPTWGETLEPQIIAANSEQTLKRVLKLTDVADVGTWMRNNKTEAALRIFDSAETIKFPDYIVSAVELLK
jgi:hypothetical protein